MSRYCATSPSRRCRSAATTRRGSLGELRGAALLDGVRGAKPADREALVDLIVALSRFAADHADAVAEIDLNPVIVHPEGEGLTVVDALIVKEDRRADIGGDDGRLHRVHTESMTDYTGFKESPSPRRLVATVEMRRPPHNFFDAALIAEIGQAFERLDADPAIRTIVLAAEGRSFLRRRRFLEAHGHRHGAGIHPQRRRTASL